MTHPSSATGYEAKSTASATCSREWTRPGTRYRQPSPHSHISNL